MSAGKEHVYKVIALNKFPAFLGAPSVMNMCQLQVYDHAVVLKNMRFKQKTPVFLTVENLAPSPKRTGHSSIYV